MSELFKVTDSLFISNARAACKRDLLILEGITCCINISRRQPFPDIDLHALRIPVFDHPLQNLSDYFDQCADLIASTMASGGKCLVYCKHGRSRSATICIAYLMKYKNLQLREAFQMVKDVRPSIEPNTGFWSQLESYEESLQRRT
ncbi:dual specificity phosphatase 28 isoform X1 [Bombina bombina]|uniref:dual specificity phosphatase 28 isoform X1 n=1 Tax=Bombina bombina TaxID=8345 RepID=UPI00235AE985|nr:dual specificity phosphatase 28 isoform X1 [Bombina bombina]